MIRVLCPAENSTSRVATALAWTQSRTQAPTITMFARSLILALSLAAPAAAYTKKDREDAIKWITEEKGFPHLAAFDKMVLRGVL